MGCATAFGLVGVWCMHFIGNRAIILGNGHPDRQLVYNAGYTTLSVFLPIIGLTLAFSAAEFSSRSSVLHWMSLVCTGVFAGLSVVGMHYIGNFGIANYILNYNRRFLAASMIIAIGDCLLVLMLFYTWREKWISSWWKRVLCAVFLAGGVSAMHFTASTSCEYTFRHYNDRHAIKSRDIQVSVAGALCALAAILVLSIIVFSQHRAQVLRTRSKKVMLACAMFDPEGRLLVTTEGVLPSRQITDRYQHRTFNEDFDTAHPVFQWIYRVTWNWNGVSELIPKMKSHLVAHRADSDDSKPVSMQSSVTRDIETYSDYSIVFRERFCTAAASLASAMHLPVERVGVLYDQIIETGTIKYDEKAAKRSTVQLDQKLSDMESARPMNIFGKGQLLFLTRQLSAEDADKLLNAGFKFGGIQQVGRHIADTMQVPLPALEAHVDGLRRYVNNIATLDKSGTYLACYAMIPRPNSKGFDIAVKKDDQHQLPDVQLLPMEPQPWQAEFLQRMDGLRTRSCLTFLEDRGNTDSQRSPQEQQFAMIMSQAIVNLSTQVPVDWYSQARFSGRPAYAHYSQSTRNKGALTAIYAFCVIADIHTTMETHESVTRIPLAFFSARQRCYKGSPDHSILAREIHQEFGPLLARRATSKHVSTRTPKSSRRKPSQVLSLKSTTSRSSIILHSDGSSMHELVDKPSSLSGNLEKAHAAPDRDNLWGGIMVNSETVVKSDSKSEYSHDSRGLGLGMKVAVGLARQEDTFVDELMEVTRTRFLPLKVTY